MKTIPIGVSSLETSRLAYGCWRIAGTWNPEEVTTDHEARGREAVMAAYEAGYTLFDHADVYCRGKAETIFGQVLKAVPKMRERIVIASKCGIRFQNEPRPGDPYRYDFSESHIIRSCEQSLRRLGIETIDLYQLHRPDLLGQPEEVASAFAKLREAGKVCEFGVSNFRPSQLAALRKACPMPLVVNQVEISLARLDCLQDGTLDQCLLDKITPLAWSPLAGGKLGEGSRVDLEEESRTRLLGIVDVLDAVGRECGVGRGIIALAWLLRHPAGIVPIIGSTDPGRIREAARAADVVLSREQWYRLTEAAWGKRLP